MKEELSSLIERLVYNQYQLSNCVAYEKLIQQLFDRAKEKFITNEPEAKSLKNLALELQEKAREERKKWELLREVDTATWNEINSLLDKNA